MKIKNILLIVFLFIGLTSKAQDWPIGTKWVYYQQDFIPNYIDEYRIFEVVGDTSIAALDFKMVQSFYVRYPPSGIEVYTSSNRKYLRKAGSKVWVYEPTTAKTLLLYDFDAAVGDSLTIYANAYNPKDKTIQVHITSRGTQLIDGVAWEYQNVYTPNHNCQEYMEGRVTKGIGNYYYLFPVYYCADPQTGGSLVCFDNGTLKYPSTSVDCEFLLTAIDLPHVKKISVFPNPTRDLVYIEQADFERWELWSYTGELMLEGKESTINMGLLANGVYILVVYDRKGRPAVQKIGKVE